MGNYEMTTNEYDLLERAGFIRDGLINLEVPGKIVVTKLKGMNSQKKTQIFSKMNRIETEEERIEKTKRDKWEPIVPDEWKIIDTEIVMSAVKQNKLPLLMIQDEWAAWNYRSDSLSNYAVQIPIMNIKDNKLIRLIRLQIHAGNYGLTKKEIEFLLNNGNRYIDDGLSVDVLFPPNRQKYFKMLMKKAPWLKEVIMNASIGDNDNLIEIKS
jgi:hypothetical protein